MTARPGPAVLLYALALALGGCGSDSDDAADAPAAKPPYSVSGGLLRDADGRALILRGVNLANAHKQSPYFGFHQPEDYARVRDDWGMNALRFLISWSAIEPQKGEYDDAYLDAVAQRMDWAKDGGLLVVLDMHQDIYGEGFGGDGAPRWTCDESHYAAFTPASQWFFNYVDPEVIACFDGFWNSEELRSHYAEAWRRVAARLSAHPAVVGFDVMNEPFWGSYPSTTFEADVLQPFYRDVVAAVREEAPDWVAFLEPSAGNNLGFATSLVPFTVENVVYAPHAYDPNAEQGQGFDPKAHTALVQRIEAMGADAQALGAALWIGEYGGNASQPGIAEYMDAGYAGVGKVAAGNMYWAYDKDGGYGLLDESGNDKTVLLDALVRPFPLRVAGDPIEYGFDAATRTFTLRWVAKPGTTEISVPERALPAGYAMSCDGCETETAPGICA